jgi:hypothetical protein
MDSAINTGRKFPAYTTAQLKAAVAETAEARAARYLPPLAEATRSAMEIEINRREAGVSRTFAEVLGRAAA